MRQRFLNAGTEALEVTYIFPLPPAGAMTGLALVVGERRVEAEERYSLLMASQALPSPISTGRRAGGTCPDGGCGLCRVEVLDQTGLTPMAELERNTMDAFVRGDPHEGRERSPGPPATPLSRLGCHARIVGPGARVKVDAMVDFESLKGEMNGS
jgi:ferredoxin